MCVQGWFQKQVIGGHLNLWRPNKYTEVKSIYYTLSPNFSFYLKYTANFMQLYFEFTILFEMHNKLDKP